MGARKLLPLLALLLSAGRVAQASRALLQASAPATALDVTEMTAADTVAMLCSGRLTATDYVKAIFAKLDSGYDCLNTIQTLNRTKTLAEAAAVDAKKAAGQSTAPLCGLPLLVKDSIDVAGYDTSGGTPGLLGLLPPRSAPLIDAYKAANGIILAKSRLHEMSAGYTTINTNANGFGTPLNPYNNTRHTGGSSGGSGAAVAARIAPVSLCEDTGGSCRTPGAANGVLGFRPTLGCYNASDGLTPFGFTRDTVGPMARTMDDLILLDSVIRSNNATTDAFGNLPTPVACAAPIQSNFTLAGARIGYVPDWWANMSAEYVGPATAAFDKLKAAGAVMVPLNVTAMMAARPAPPANFEGPREFSRYLYTKGYNVSINQVYAAIQRPDLKTRFLPPLLTPLYNPTADPSAWVKYLATGRPGFAKMFADLFAQNQIVAMLGPTVTATAREIWATDPFVKAGANGSWVSVSSGSFGVYASYGPLASLAGLNVPVGLASDGLPVGLQIETLPGNDGIALTLGKAMEGLVGIMPPPPKPECAGCTANVQFTKLPLWNGLGAPPPTNATSLFEVAFEGTCTSAMLKSVGRPSGSVASATSSG